MSEPKVEGKKEQEPLPASIEGTSCCAIGILHANNATPIESILGKVVEVREQQHERWVGRGPGGWTSLLAVAVMPFEAELSGKLQEAGFMPIYTCARRTGYGKGHELVHLLIIKDVE